MLNNILPYVTILFILNRKCENQATFLSYSDLSTDVINIATCTVREEFMYISGGESY